MTIYTPDRWVITKIQAVGQEPYYRILAGWYGGFTTGDSWKLSSGILKSISYDQYYEMPQSSGSVYECIKGRHGMSAYMSSIYLSFKADAQKNGVLFDVMEESFIPLLEPVAPIAVVKPVIDDIPVRSRKLSKAELKKLDF